MFTLGYSKLECGKIERSVCPTPSKYTKNKRGLSSGYESNGPNGWSVDALEYLQVELQAVPPLLQDFRNPVSHMLGGDFRRLYALL